jgi:hypothetical protein
MKPLMPARLPKIAASRTASIVPQAGRRTRVVSGFARRKAIAIGGSRRIVDYLQNLYYIESGLFVRLWTRLAGRA